MARLYEVYDPRDPEFLDIYAFRSTTQEPDEPICEEIHSTLDRAIEGVRGWGGNSRTFVNEGMVGDEYGEYLTRGT